jgi:hypothetical protein
VATRWRDRFHDHRHVFLLVTLCLLEILYPITRSVYSGYRLLELFFVLVFLASVYAVATHRWVRIIAMVLVTPSVLSYLSAAGIEFFELDAPLWLVWMRAVATTLILLFSGIIILGQVLRAKRINVDKVCGAISVYMMFGAIWTTLYAMVLLASPDAIHFPDTLVVAATAEVDSSTGDAETTITEVGVATADSRRSTKRSELANFHALNYFSFVTLSTLGYGDVLPVSPIARMLAWVEAVFGQLYLAVLIGHIVGLQVAHTTAQVAQPKKEGARGG